jgi:hypothetical protein
LAGRRELLITSIRRTRKEVIRLTKAALIVSAVLLFAGVAAAGSLTGLGGSSDNPTADTPTLTTTTTSSTPTTTTGTQNDVSGPCDEPEHANDPACAGAAPDRAEDNEDDDRGRDNEHGDRSGPSESSGRGGGDSDDD